MRVLLFCLIFLSLSCTKRASFVQQKSGKPENSSQTIESFLGNENAQIDNITKTHTLIYQSSVESAQLTKYLVLDNASQKIVLKGSFKPGYIRWKTDTLLEILDLPGIIPNGKTQSDYIKTITISTQEK